jgi:hypothetical protein
MPRRSPSLTPTGRSEYSVSATEAPSQNRWSPWLKKTTGGRSPAAARASTGTGSFGCVCSTTKSASAARARTAAARSSAGASRSSSAKAPPEASAALPTPSERVPRWRVVTTLWTRWSSRSIQRQIMRLWPPTM